MNLVLLFLLLGLGAGGVYALLGLGLVLKYRATQVIDFAHAAVAMYSAYVFVNLRSNGRLELPWIVLPHEIQIASAGIDVLPALAITLVYGTLLGYVLFLVVYRPLLRAAPLTKVCASVGVMLGLEAIAVLNFGTTSLATGPVLPSTPIRIAGVAFPSDRLVLLGIVVVAALGLLALYRFTRFGLATQGERGERDRRGPDRHLPDRHRHLELGARQRLRRAVRRPHHADLVARPDLVHALHRPGARRGPRRALRVLPLDGRRRHRPRRLPVRGHPAAVAGALAAAPGARRRRALPPHPHRDDGERPAPRRARRSRAP